MMKNYCIALTLLLIVSACKENKTPESLEITETKEEVLDVTTAIYPENITKVFNAHGGIDLWKSMKSLEYTQERASGKEVTITDLNNRKAFINSENHTIGFDGEKPWLLNKTDKDYKGYDPKFGYNLMFYFYTMPFILSDDGINFSEAEPLVFENVTYPGIKITYNSGVGATPEDIYILYYNPKTFKMEWLGYTVNFVPGIDTKELHFRRYSDWQEVNGLILPKTITGYGFKNDKPTTPKSPNVFTNVKLTKIAPDNSMFNKPEKANYVD